MNAVQEQRDGRWSACRWRHSLFFGMLAAMAADCLSLGRHGDPVIGGHHGFRWVCAEA